MLFFPVIAPLATQKYVAACRLRINLCLEAQLHGHIHLIWKYGLLLKSGSASSLSMVVLSKINSQSWFVQRVLAVLYARDAIMVEHKTDVWQNSAGVFLGLWKTPLGSGCLAWTFHPQELVLCVSEAQHCRWKICFISVYLSMLLARNNSIQFIRILSIM